MPFSPRIRIAKLVAPLLSKRVAVPALLLALPVAAVAGWPLGSRLERSLVVDLTDEGFASLRAFVDDFIPPRIDVPPIQQDDESGCFLGACLYAYDISIANLFVEVAINQLDITPASGNILNLYADAVVTVNNPSDAADLDIMAELASLEIIDDSCALWVDPINVTINGPIQLMLVPDPNGADVDGDTIPDTKLLDVVIPPMSWSWDATGDHIQFTGCGLASVINTVNTVTSFFGVDIYDLILGFVEPEIDSLVNSLPAEIEPLLEETFASLNISEEIDLLGVPLTLNLWPDALSTTNDGMRIEMASVTSTAINPCVADYGVTESAATPTSLPAIGEGPAGLGFNPAASALIDDDFINQVLYGVWAGGLLCYEISSDSEDISLPLPIDTTLLGLMAPGVFDSMFPQTAPMEIRTLPRKPPYVVPDGNADVSIVAEDLGLGFFVEIDGRKTRLMNVDLKADVGIDLVFDGATGNLAIDVGLDAGAITPTVNVNEFRPDDSELIASSFGGLFDAIVGPLVGGLLTDLSFALPSFEGLGVLDMAIAPTGSANDMVGAFVTVGTVPYYSAGCDEGGGCTSGCSGGCTTGTGSARLVLFLIPLLAVGLRRRR